MLIDALQKIKQQTIITSLVAMILGLLMLIIPEQYDAVLVTILGYVVILFGAVMIWNFIGSDKKLMNWIFFIIALLLILLGTYVHISGNDVLEVLSFLFGILLIIDGIHSFVYAWVYVRRSGGKRWWFLVLLSGLLILSGIIIFNNPWWPTTRSFVKIIGGTVLFASVVGIVRLIMVWPIRKA